MNCEEVWRFSMAESLHGGGALVFLLKSRSTDPGGKMASHRRTRVPLALLAALVLAALLVVPVSQTCELLVAGGADGLWARNTMPPAATLYLPAAPKFAAVGPG